MSLYPGVCGCTLEIANAPTVIAAITAIRSDRANRAPISDGAVTRKHHAKNTCAATRLDDLDGAQHPDVANEREHRPEQQLELGARPQVRAGVHLGLDVVAFVGEVQASAHRGEEHDEPDEHDRGDDETPQPGELVGDVTVGIGSRRRVDCVRRRASRGPVFHERRAYGARRLRPSRTIDSR